MAYLEDIPKYALGTAFRVGAGWPRDADITEANFVDLVEKAIKLGCRHIDCAPLYQTQHLVGQALKNANKTTPRQDIFITSKVPPNMMRPENLVRSIKKSLDELQLSYLDLILLHAPFSTTHVTDDQFYPTDADGNVLLDDDEGLLEKAWMSLVDLKKKGFTRFIGISNINLEQLQRLNSLAHVDVVQNEYHIYNQDREIFDYCEEIDVHFEAYAAFGSPLRSRLDGKPSAMSDMTVNRVAKANNLSIAQVIMQWIHQQPLSYVIRCDNVKQLEENLKATYHVFVSINDMIDLDSLNRDVRVYSFDEHKGLDRHKEYPFHSMNTKDLELQNEHNKQGLLLNKEQQQRLQEQQQLHLLEISQAPQQSHCNHQTDSDDSSDCVYHSTNLNEDHGSFKDSTSTLYQDYIDQDLSASKPLPPSPSP